MPTLLFEGSDEPLDPRELSDYIYLLKAAYSHGLRIAPKDEHEVLKYFDDYAEEFRAMLPDEGAVNEVDELFGQDDGPHSLKLSRISKSSPLEIGAICIVSALVLAVIFSGGKVDLKGLKFHLPPLGVGIKSLREALKVGSRTRRQPKIDQSD